MMTHTVKRGDTLSYIAKSYNTTVDDIVKANEIKNKDLIYVGQVLKIPTTVPPVTNNSVYNALVSCLDAIEDLPEFKTLEEIVNG